MATSAIGGHHLALDVAIGAAGGGVGSLQRQRVLKGAHIGPLESCWRVAVFTGVAKVGLWRGVAIGADVLRFALARMAVVAPDLSVLALELDGMLKSCVQLYFWPGPGMAGRIGAEARVVVTEGDLTVAFLATLICLEAVVGHEVGLQVGSRLLNVGQGHLRRPVIAPHRLGDAVADVAVEADRLALIRQMLPIVATEATGKVLVLVVVGEVLPGDPWLLKHQLVKQRLGQLICSLNLIALVLSHVRVFLLIFGSNITDGCLGVVATGMACGQQI
jgi:hypothetical protein